MCSDARPKMINEKLVMITRLSLITGQIACITDSILILHKKKLNIYNGYTECYEQTAISAKAME